MGYRPDRTSTVAWMVLGLVLVCGALVVAPRAPREILPADFERNVHSQAGEDGILEKIFEVIPPTQHYAVEFGAGEGIEFSNVRKLIVREGWRGLLIEGDHELAAILARNYQGFSGVRTVEAWVFPGNVELLFEENLVPRDLDLLVIDIDSNDYYVWRAIREFRPKVVLIEYNGVFAPPQKVVIGFHPLTYWDGKSAHFGASIQSLCDLGRRKGYELVAVNDPGINLFFVDARYYERFGIRDNSPTTLYRPYGHVTALGPKDLGLVMSPDGRALPPAEDIVLPEVTIEKRFRLDR